MSVKKICKKCKKSFISKSNRAIRCPSCQTIYRKESKKQAMRKRSPTWKKNQWKKWRKKICIGSSKPVLGGKDCYKIKSHGCGNNEDGKNPSKQPKWAKLKKNKKGENMSQEDIDRIGVFYTIDTEGNFHCSTGDISKERCMEFEHKFEYLRLRKNESIESWKKRVEREVMKRRKMKKAIQQKKKS